ncbi:MAG: hypothetical protein WHS46_05515 [Desulfosoma sp.]
MVRHMVQRTHRGCRKDVPNVVQVDQGFFDSKLFEVFEELDGDYTCSGRVKKDALEYAPGAHRLHRKRFVRDKEAWEYTEFGSRRDS